jgi:putative FmdB family regulatory protein
MTYDYLCKSCGHAWEETQRIVDPPVVLCPACRKDAAERQISGGTGSGFVLGDKGTIGWGRDLYANKPTAPPVAGGKE